jgi:(1->4)-alpha-D-glucan 1-alpha-D-glucosylmutase
MPNAEAVAESLFEALAREAVETPLRRPAATYRVQMNKGFRFDDLTAAADYLAALGVTDCYMSPYLRAKPGSTHGYDIFDHGQLNPEIGDDAAHERLVERLSELGLGRVLDVVPNHMGIAGPNPYWLEVLEAGAQAPSARFFDIDWHPVKEELDNRVLLPILEDQYGKVLEAGLLTIAREGGSFFVRYYENRLPLSPRSYAQVFERRADELAARFDADDPNVLEYRSIWASAYHLPDRAATDLMEVEAVVREKEVIKRRIVRLCEECPDLCHFVDENVASFRGTEGDPASFNALHDLLEQQVYRLAYWRVAADEINYRRFFDINDLAGLRTEDPTVFGLVHRLVLRWLGDGGVTGLRIDHPDGLADPRGYLVRLQEAAFVQSARRRFEAAGHAANDWPLVAGDLRRRFREAAEAEPLSPLVRRLPVVVEKILSRGEDLPDDWPVDGTVGYEFLNTLNGLFVQGDAAGLLDEVYVEFTGDREPFAEVLYHAKQLITRASLASEVNMLARQLNRVSEGDRRSRDFTLNDLRRATREAIACFPVYRTYIHPGHPVSDRDRASIDRALHRARRRNPTTDASVYEFLREALLLEHPPGVTPAARALREGFVVRFQQTTGPVQAKGLEDTAFYRQVRLTSLNEVGADPARFGTSPSIFHALNSQRLKTWPSALATTATHDTKRGEDTRIRINVLSELPEEWRVHLARWSRWNARKKIALDECSAPDAREEYLFYQVLLGAWPFGGPGDAAPAGFVERIQQYMVKAVREAKLNASWTDTDSSYCDAITRFVAEILEGPDAGPFLKDFLPFQRRVARIGVVHSLAQTLLKLVSPGVPDIYQGCEFWDLSLVDPDNRRPVDYGLRQQVLASVRKRLGSGTTRADLAHTLFATPDDGAIKLYLTWTILNHRKANQTLYEQGAYRSLEPEGERKTNVVALARLREGRCVVAVAPRLVASLMGEDGQGPPLGQMVWGDTRVPLPEGVGTNGLRDLLTDRLVTPQRGEDGTRLFVSDIFYTLPIALLIDLL